VDDLVLAGQPVDHRAEARLTRPQVREHRLVLQGVMSGHHPAIGGAVRSQRPAVAPHRHLVDGRPGLPDVHLTVPDLTDEVPDLGEFRAQVIMNLDEVPGDRAPERGVRRIRRRLRAVRPG